MRYAAAAEATITAFARKTLSSTATHSSTSAACLHLGLESHYPGVNALGTLTLL